MLTEVKQKKMRDFEKEENGGYNCSTLHQLLFTYNGTTESCCYFAVVYSLMSYFIVSGWELFAGNFSFLIFMELDIKFLFTLAEVRLIHVP